MAYLFEFYIYFLYTFGLLSASFLNAARDGDIETVRQYINEHRNYSYRLNVKHAIYGETALILATISGYLDIVQELTAAGADVNCYDCQPRTALMYAAKDGDIDIVRCLLAVPGINVNAVRSRDPNGYKDKGDTALLYAIRGDHLDVVKALVAVPGINVTITQNENETALMVAAAYGNFEIVQALLTVPNIDVRARSSRGYKASGIAKLYGHIEIANLLKQFNSGNGYDPMPIVTNTGLSFSERLANIPDFNQNDIPKEFIDPISFDIINDPVVFRSGITYDRESLAQYFVSRGNPSFIECPITRDNIHKIELRSNKSSSTIKNLIEKFVRNEEDKHKKRHEVEKGRESRLRFFSSDASTVQDASSAAPVTSSNML